MNINVVNSKSASLTQIGHC